MKLISLHQKATILRAQGFSYGMISEKLGLSKSTLSDWLREIPYQPNKQVIERIGFAKLKSAQHKRQQRMNEIKEMKTLAKKEIGEINNRDLLMLGIGLYLGEGSKINESIKLINSDPKIIRLAIKWFKNVCKLENENFVPSVHSYPDNNIKQILIFWSKVTGIPINRFGKTQIDGRENKLSKKKNKLPYGTLHLQIKSCGKKQFGRLLHRKIMGWIEVALG